MAGGIFVSYRRDDAAHVTGRIADALATRFGRDHIFMDVDSVAPGEDFVRKIKATIQSASTFLAVIGPGWLTAATPGGVRRIDLDGDFIRLEVKSALAAGVRIIPVLVDGASMPRAEDLPQEIAQLVRHNAVQISHTTFSRDVSALVEQLAQPGLQRRLLAPRVTAGAAAIVAIAALGITLWPRGDGKASTGFATSVSIYQDETAASDRYRNLASIDFRAERDSSGGLSILTDLPYLARLTTEHRLDGMMFSHGPIAARMPQLLVQITNTSPQPITINEIQFDVRRAEPDLTPLPVIRENPFDYHLIKLVNEGWGPFVSSRLTITAWGAPETDRDRSRSISASGVTSDEPCANPDHLVTTPALTVDGVLDSDGETTVFDLEGKMPGGFGDALYICAIGELAYAHAGGAERFSFRTRVSNHHPTSAVAAPFIALYDLYLDPDRDGYVAIVPAVREIAAGATDTIAVTIYTDRSSRFALRHSVRTASGAMIKGDAFALEIIVPRHGGGGFIQNKPAEPLLQQ